MPTARSPEQELAPEPAPAPEQERPRRYSEWASPYREGQMPAAGMPSTPQRSPAPSGMDHSARRRRRGGGGGDEGVPGYDELAARFAALKRRPPNA